MKDKFSGMRIPRKGRVFLLAALLLVGVITAGGTLAWLMTSSDKVANSFVVPEFTPTIQESFNGATKSNVCVENTVASGKTGMEVYIRVALVPTWETTEGAIAPIPASMSDLNISLNTNNGWFKSGDYYYYRDKVEPGKATNILIQSATVKSGTSGATAGYKMNMQVLAEAIQATQPAVTEAWPGVWDSLNK